jgi:hypothetical protein
MISTNAFRTPAIAGALVLALVAAPALADSPAAKTDAKAKESAAWTPPQPGAEHARLKNSVGKWKINQKATFDPSKPPVIGEGTEECTLICNGLFLRSDYHVKDANGDFYGAGVLGYDTMKKKYTGTWVDSYSTMNHPYEGTCEGNTCTFNMVVLGEDGKPMSMTLIFEEVDKDHRKFTMRCPGPDGQLMTTMETMYTRM